MNDVLEKPPVRTGGGPSITISVASPTPEAMADMVERHVRAALKDYSLYAEVRRHVTETEGGVTISIRDEGLSEDHPVIRHILGLISGINRRGGESA